MLVFLSLTFKANPYLLENVPLRLVFSQLYCISLFLTMPALYLAHKTSKLFAQLVFPVSRHFKLIYC